MSGTKLYTFVMDWDGGAFISQSNEENVEEATIAWLNLLTDEDLETSKSAINSLKNSLLNNLNPTKLENNISVWCLSDFLNGELAIINIVLTQENETAIEPNSQKQ